MTTRTDHEQELRQQLADLAPGQQQRILFILTTTAARAVESALALLEAIERATPVTMTVNGAIAAAADRAIRDALTLVDQANADAAVAAPVFSGLPVLDDEGGEDTLDAAPEEHHLASLRDRDHYTGLCAATTPTRHGHAYVACSLQAGHDGDHVAGGTGNPPASWPEGGHAVWPTASEADAEVTQP